MTKTPTVFLFQSSNTARQTARWRWWTQSAMLISVPSPPPGEGSVNPVRLDGFDQIGSIGMVYFYLHGCFRKANSRTPKSSILIRFSIINHPFWGTPIFGNTHIYIVDIEMVNVGKYTINDNGSYGSDGLTMFDPPKESEAHFRSEDFLLRTLVFMWVLGSFFCWCLEMFEQKTVTCTQAMLQVTFFGVVKMWPPTGGSKVHGLNHKRHILFGFFMIKSSSSLSLAPIQTTKCKCQPKNGHPKICIQVSQGSTHLKSLL